MKHEVLVCLGMLTAATPCNAQGGTAVASTTVCAERSCLLLEFHSSFWLNLHNYLFMEARLRQNLPASTIAGAGDRELLERQMRPLSPEEELIRERVLNTFVVSRRSGPLPDSVVLRVENRLAAIVDESGLESVDLRPEMREALRHFAPIYREVWWPTQDAANRDWIAVQQSTLDVVGDHLLQRLVSAFRSEPPENVRVDASAYANWFGAYTTFEPPHITMSSSAAGSVGSLGLETLLHETGHLVLKPVDDAIADAAARQGRPPPRQLSHLLLFFTAGEIVREVIASHTPYAEEFGIWRQNSAARQYQRLLRRFWSPYLRGEIGFDEAIDRLVQYAPT